MYAHARELHIHIHIHLQAWQVVHELEESVRLKDMEEEAVKDLEYTQNQLGHMVGVWYMEYGVLCIVYDVCLWYMENDGSCIYFMSFCFFAHTLTYK
ncbi:hypothetical protein EON63_24470 [archaeon]|nr:MAG: hypothetical protein EON63_24470 [archaeon]